MSWNDCLAAFGLCQLIEVSLPSIQGGHGEEPHVAVPSWDYSNELLAWDKLDLMNLLIVTNTDNLCNKNQNIPPTQIQVSNGEVWIDYNVYL